MPPTALREKKNDYNDPQKLQQESQYEWEQGASEREREPTEKRDLPAGAVVGSVPVAAAVSATS